MNIVAYLNQALPTFKFYPSRGGGDIDEPIAPEPPFGVVIIDDTSQTLSGDVWMMHGHIVWVTSMDREGVIQASQEARSINEALKTFPSGFDSTHNLIVHGFDIDATDEFSDNDRQARGDTLAFSIGVTQGS